jgi:hypothetical protein
LRYFNAAGAEPTAEIGEDHNPETHLIPLVLDVALGKRPEVQIFGTDYPTPDGTALRDYVHVCDLAQAHVLAVKYLLDHRKTIAVNLGSGQSISVRQVIDTVQDVTDTLFAKQSARRPGDPAELWPIRERHEMCLVGRPKGLIPKQLLPMLGLARPAIWPQRSSMNHYANSNVDLAFSTVAICHFPYAFVRQGSVMVANSLICNARHNIHIPSRRARN